jgi:hypothetical protein
VRICAALVLAACACGNHRAPARRRDAGAAVAGSAAATVLELPARPLGAASLAELGWRKRAGQPAFRAAQRAEAAGDWAAVVRECSRALAADPTHLDAAWLLAIARAKTGGPGALDEVTAPLAQAAAGDYGKWAVAALVHPALHDYLATPAGIAWHRRAEADRALYLAALARALVVRADGDLFAYDVTSPRWYRLTRTNGHVIAAMPSGRRIAYVTRSKGKLGVGAIDLETGRSTHPVDVGAGPIDIAAIPTGFWIGATTFSALALDGALATAPPKRPDGPHLHVTANGTARLVRLPIAQISGDWDDQGVASAIQIGTTKRIVTVPSPGVIAGNTIAWSPDRSHVAFVAQLAEQCAPHAPTVAAVVADVATGAIRELSRSVSGLAVEWVTDRELAIAGDGGVAIAPIATGSAAPIDGATGLAEPMVAAKCTHEEPVAEGSDDDESP